MGLLLGAFGEACNGCGPTGGGAPESMMAGPGTAQPNPLLNELGFTSVETYLAWLESLTPAQLEAHIAVCIEIINDAE